MPITGVGWELHIVRKTVQRRSSSGRRRTVGAYQVFHDGVPQTGMFMRGTSAESKGLGANSPENNGLRVEAKTYPVATQGGSNYVTWGYSAGISESAKPKPGFELTKTGKRTEILIHPGRGFLASVGCINLCTSLPHPDEDIGYPRSRERVIAVIENMKAFVGNKFPSTNGKNVPRASVVIDGEP